MNQAVAFSISDYIVEIGNHFFNLNEDDWNIVQDDLTYELTDRDGFNGYVLKIEETADGYSNKLLGFLMLSLNWFQSLFEKNDLMNNESNKQALSNKKVYVDSHTAIQNRVRSRLLEIINEDIDYWHETPMYKSKGQKKIVRKNQFKDHRDNQSEKSNALRKAMRLSHHISQLLISLGLLPRGLPRK